MSFSIVAKKFTVKEFEEYLKTIGKQGWVKRIVLHNTASPSLAQRKNGVLTAQHIKNLHNYYQNKGWSGGPHLFIDAEGIWVFNPLDDPGVHSPSYNKSAWGVEMLGNYESESFTTGLGAKVAENAKGACAALAKMQDWVNLQEQRLILHKEDTATDHNCPGKNVIKSTFIAETDKLISGDKEKPELKIMVNSGSKKTKVVGGFVREGVTYVPLRALSVASQGKMVVIHDPASNTVNVEF